VNVSHIHGIEQPGGGTWLYTFAWQCTACSLNQQTIFHAYKPALSVHETVTTSNSREVRFVDDSCGVVVQMESHYCLPPSPPMTQDHALHQKVDQLSYKLDSVQSHVTMRWQEREAHLTAKIEALTDHLRVLTADLETARKRIRELEGEPEGGERL